MSVASFKPEAAVYPKQSRQNNPQAHVVSLAHRVQPTEYIDNL